MRLLSDPKRLLRSRQEPFFGDLRGVFGSSGTSDNTGDVSKDVIKGLTGLFYKGIWVFSRKNLTDRKGIIDDASVTQEEITLFFEDGTAAELAPFVGSLPVGRE